MIPELRDLNAIRLDENLSYRDLEARTGIAYRTLYELLTSDDPRPYDRTLHRIRKFLDAQPKASKRRQRASA